ncbi:hypothetical protein B0T25DRAFT_329518 [Lasiosphaeria hispida]|uniref:Uncharacterized protein n=1 Tax=Lasiosphaeria hispida TaxID=260671 RepID=A0AAJ0H5J1_9PEZI|nr:hypothetical protein B0T25DRAFT_329518 [Lasiosphaeria hispida]
MALPPGPSADRVFDATSAIPCLGILVLVSQVAFWTSFSFKSKQAITRCLAAFFFFFFFLLVSAVEGALGIHNLNGNKLKLAKLVLHRALTLSCCALPSFNEPVAGMQNSDQVAGSSRVSRAPTAVLLSRPCTLCSFSLCTTTSLCPRLRLSKASKPQTRTQLGLGSLSSRR